MKHELSDKFYSDVSRLTAAQYYAAANVDHSIVVTAGAGAGKTGVLVARYMALLHSGVTPKQIVAITFTRKAATEMAERVQKELLKQVDKFPQARSWLAELPYAPITTIHGLAALILRRFPLKAGIDPRFKMLEDYDSKESLNSAISKVFEKWLVKETPTMGVLYPELKTESCLESLFNLITLIRNRGESLDTLIQESLTKASNMPEPPWSIYFNVCQECLGNLSQSATKVREFVEQIRDYCAQIEQGNNDLSIVLALLSNANELQKSSTKAAVKVIDDLNNVGVSGFCETLSTYFERLSHPYFLSIMQLVMAISSEFSQEKARKGGLDFSDLESMAVTLLDDSEVIIELQREWRYFLVDEFQDVNYAQYKIVNQLAGNRIAEALYVCGDPKQSIYRFRGAVVELFREMEDYLKLSVHQGKSNIIFGDNFRSLAPLVQGINQIFTDVLPELHHDMLANRQKINDTPAIELILTSGEKVMYQRLNEAKALALRLEEIVLNEEPIIQVTKDSVDSFRATRWEDIALLFRSRASLGIYQKALQARNIPVLVYGGRSFFAKNEVLLIKHLLGVILRPDDKLALWIWLTSPLIGIQPESLTLAHLEQQASLEKLKLDHDNAEKYKKAFADLKRWRSFLGTMPRDEFLEYLIKELNLSEYYALQEDGERYLANIYKLVALTRDLDARDDNTWEQLYKIIEAIADAGFEDERETAHETNVPNAVKLMTIHAAKGLEFPLVVLPDLLRQPKAYSLPNFLQFGKNGFFLPHNISKSAEEKAFEVQQSDAEDRRLIYVALTRARDYLIICGVSDEDKKLKVSPNCWWGLLKPVLEKIPAEMKTIKQFNKGELDSSLVSLNSLTDEDDKWVTPDFFQNEPPWQELSLSPARDNSLAVTSLLNYQQCPRLFYYQSFLKLAPVWQSYHDNYKESAENGLSLTEAYANSNNSFGLDAFRFGSFLHKLTEAVIIQTREKVEMINLDKMIVSRAPIFGYAAEELPDLQHRALPLLQNFLKSELIPIIDKASSLFCELPFTFTLPSGQMINGIIDLLICHEDGSFSIYDFKTNNLSRQGVNKLIEQYRLQLELYVIATKEWLKAPLKEAGIFLLRAEPGSEIVPILFGDDLLSTQALAEVIPRTDALTHKLSTSWHLHHFKATREIDKCRNCGYKSFCLRFRRPQKLSSF